MFEQIEEYFYGEPGRITQSGKWMAMAGAYLMFAAAIGQFVTRTANVFPTFTDHTETTEVLADIYPTLPLWWVPESWFGIFFSVAVIAIGVVVNEHGKKVERLFFRDM